jgi:hypothetical protein
VVYAAKVIPCLVLRCAKGVISEGDWLFLPLILQCRTASYVPQRPVRKVTIEVRSSATPVIVLNEFVAAKRTLASSHIRPGADIATSENRSLNARVGRLGVSLQALIPHFSCKGASVRAEANKVFGQCRKLGRLKANFPNVMDVVFDVELEERKGVIDG